MSRIAGKYGLRPPPAGKKWGFRFSDYLDATRLPPIPEGAFGHTDKVEGPWEILLNDQLGCCVVSGAEHETMLWTAEAGRQAVFNDAATIHNYCKLGNYQPGNPDTDQGCDMLHAAKLRIRDGIVDWAGHVHKIGIALELDCGPGWLNMTQFWYACWLFDGLGLGIDVTSAWKNDFEAGRDWDAADYNPNDVVGGHYVPAVARVNADGRLCVEVVTWGERQMLTVDGLQACTVTVLCYASPEKLHNGRDLEGLSWSDMRSDIRKIGRL
jgi:hypothetical protein